jgi:hypothetical protein
MDEQAIYRAIHAAPRRAPRCADRLKPRAHLPLHPAGDPNPDQRDQSPEGWTKKGQKHPCAVGVHLVQFNPNDTTLHRLNEHRSFTATSQANPKFACTAPSVAVKARCAGTYPAAPGTPSLFALWP